MVAAILELDVELVPDMIADRLRDGDAAWAGGAFDAGGEVDAVAVNVAVLGDNVAEVDADAHLNPAVVGKLGVLFAHPLLDASRAFDRADDAGELGEEAVAGQLDHPAVVSG